MLSEKKSVSQDKWSTGFIKRKVKSFIFGEDSPKNSVSCGGEETIGEAFERIKSNNVNLWTFLSVKYPQVSDEHWLEIWQHQTADTYRLLKRFEKEAKKKRKLEEKRLKKEKKTRKCAVVPSQKLWFNYVLYSGAKCSRIRRYVLPDIPFGQKSFHMKTYSLIQCLSHRMFSLDQKAILV